MLGVDDKTHVRRYIPNRPKLFTVLFANERIAVRRHSSVPVFRKHGFLARVASVVSYFYNAGWPPTPSDDLERSFFPVTASLDSAGNTASLPFLRQIGD
jgi:hypothetical protein